MFETRRREKTCSRTATHFFLLAFRCRTETSPTSKIPHLPLITHNLRQRLQSHDHLNRLIAVFPTPRHSPSKNGCPTIVRLARRDLIETYHRICIPLPITNRATCSKIFPNKPTNDARGYPSSKKTGGSFQRVESRANASN